MKGVVLVVVSMFISSVCAADDGVWLGRVYDSDSGKPIYIEEHRIVARTGGALLTSRYYGVDESLIGEREVAYEGDRVAKYTLQQAQLGLQESIERTEQGIRITATKEDGLKTVLVPIDEPERVVIDAGFDDFIVREWNRLASGRTIKFPFASTGQMDVVNLQIKRIDHKDPLLADARKLRFEMTVANAFLRLLVTPITIEYYADTKELASYRGISNIKDAQGENFDAYIEFERNAVFRELARAAKPFESKIDILAN